MTRLLPSDLESLASSWPEFDKELLKLTGSDLLSLAASTLDVPKTRASELLKNCPIAVVPQSTGEGLIEGFSGALASICQHLGASPFITQNNKAGFQEAKDKEARLTLSSDDDNYLAVRLSDGHFSENGQATGRGFAEILIQMNGGKISGEKVLVLGCGPVGQSAALHLLKKGADLYISDPNLNKLKAVTLLTKAKTITINPGSPPPRDIKIILDATTASFVFPQEQLPQGSLISAPGVPLSFKPAPNLSLWHDPLQTGTAVMLLEALL